MAAPIEPATPLMMRRGCADQALPPLADLAAVADEERLFRLPQRAVDRLAESHWIDPSAVGRARRLPFRRSIGDRPGRLAVPGVAGIAAPSGPRQLIGGEGRVGEHAQHQPVALLASDPLDGFRFRVDDHEPAARIDERRLREAKREIVLLSEQQDEVGAGKQVCERSEARIVHPARAFHPDRRHLEGGAKARQSLAGGRAA